MSFWLSGARLLVVIENRRMKWPDTKHAQRKREKPTELWLGSLNAVKV